MTANLRHLPLAGVSVSSPARQPLARRCTVWFALGFFAAATVAGFLAGLLP